MKTELLHPAHARTTQVTVDQMVLTPSPREMAGIADHPRAKGSPSAVAGEKQGFEASAGMSSWGQAENGRSSDVTCAICLVEYEGGCLLRVIVPCGHMFHAR